MFIQSSFRPGKFLYPKKTPHNEIPQKKYNLMKIFGSLFISFPKNWFSRWQLRELLMKINERSWKEKGTLLFNGPIDTKSNENEEKFSSKMRGNSNWYNFLIFSHPKRNFFVFSKEIHPLFRYTKRFSQEISCLVTFLYMSPIGNNSLN